MNTEQPICGKVAELLNSREVALNIGSENGVELNMIFDIFPKSANEISDPDTGELIGTLRRSKVRVRVTVVEKKFSVASTYRTKTVVNQGTFPWTAIGSRPSRQIKEETLKMEDARHEELSETDSYISRGDPVEQVTD